MSAKPPADGRAISDLRARVEAERAGRPFLLYRDGDDRQQLFFLESGSAGATVGRERSSDLRLNWDDRVSRLHARFEQVDNGWELVDDGPSRNGTFVNGERLSGRCRLTDGDTLQFGSTTMTFRSAKPARSGAEDAVATPAAVSLSTTQRRVLAALCRPYQGRGSASPATDEQIAEELFLSVGEVQTHLRVLYAKLGIEELPQNETRVRLVERAVSAGLLSERDL